MFPFSFQSCLWHLPRHADGCARHVCWLTPCLWGQKAHVCFLFSHSLSSLLAHSTSLLSVLLSAFSLFLFPLVLFLGKWSGVGSGWGSTGAAARRCVSVALFKWCACMYVCVFFFPWLPPFAFFLVPRRLNERIHLSTHSLRKLLHLHLWQKARSMSEIFYLFIGSFCAMSTMKECSLYLTLTFNAELHFNWTYLWFWESGKHRVA